jgi:DNA-binding NarL/FixJ family response regulator
MGFVSKSAPKHVLFAAIDSVLAGNIYAPKSSSLSLSEPHKFDFSSDLNVDSITDSLTRRQLDILGLMAKGLSNKLIARELSLSGNTVKVHVSAILRVLNVDNRTQAGLIGQKLDLANRSQLRPDSED